MPEGGVPSQVAGQEISGRCKLPTDEAQAEEPGSHGVFGVFVLLGFGACRPHILRHLAQGQAKLNVAFELSGMDAASALCGRLVKLEEPELDRTFGKGGVKVEHMVAAVVVVVTPAVACAVAGVPDVRKLCHRLGLSAVDLGEEVWVYRAAVAAHAAAVELQSFCDQALVARHDVGEVPKALRCVALRSDVDVDSASSGGVAFRSCVSELPAKLLQGFDIPVGQDRGDQFAFLLVRPCDGNILLEFPLAPIRIPSRPGAVPVAAGGVLVSVCAEVGGGNLCCLLAGDVIHLDLDPDGLVLHLCNLPCCFLVHSEILRFSASRLCVFPFGVHIFALKEDNSKFIPRYILHKDDRRILCSLWLFAAIRYWLEKAVFLLIKDSKSQAESRPQPIDEVLLSGHARNGGL